MMRLSWIQLTEALDQRIPQGSTARKLLQIFAFVLMFQGAALVLLSSKYSPLIGLPLIAFGILLFVLLPPELGKAEKESVKEEKLPETPTIGIRIVDYVVDRIGGRHTLVAIGVIIIVLDVAFNTFASSRPTYGDLDTLSIMMGASLVAYPFVAKRYKVEAVFALVFLVLVFIFLVVPQAFMAIASAEGSHAGNWYVHYMLAEPFAGALNLLGISASSNEEWVTYAFHDGTIHTLGISTACAGLYSFSIFVSAFFSFMLVFQRLPNWLMVLVLSLGLIIAYLGNLFRMIVIGVVGYYNGIDALLWAHKNVGWMVFLGWSAAFWYLVIRFADKRALGKYSKGGASER